MLANESRHSSRFQATSLVHSMLDVGSDVSAIDLTKAPGRMVGLRVSEKPPERFLDLMLT